VRVDGGGDDRNIGVMLVKFGEPLGAGQEADELDRGRLRALEPLDRGARRVACGEHRIADDHLAIREILGHLVEVLDRLEGGVVPVQSDVTDPG
jgi:hypothetical protein